MAPKGGAADTVPKEFRCSATGKPLYLPVITTDGIPYSYVALFDMFMQAPGLPVCKVTKNPIAFFPHVCMPLHYYLMDEFPAAMKSRKLQDEAETMEKFGIPLPQVDPAPEQDGDEGFMEVFECAVSHELAYEPCCLSSGTMVSAYCVPLEGFKKDPDRLVACALHGQAPKVSPTLEAMIKSKFPKEYSQRASELARQAVRATTEHARGTWAEPDAGMHAFWGLGCDGCGLWPIRGPAWEDSQCRDRAGFHLCDQCYQYGYHRRVVTGKFNQHHMPKHRMECMVANDFMA